VGGGVGSAGRSRPHIDPMGKQIHVI